MNLHKEKYRGFSLIEVLVALVTSVMVLVAVFAIYDRTRRTSDSINRKLDSYVLTSEILQRIAEDIDRIAGPGANATITVGNSFQSGLPAAQLVISSQILDKDGKPQILEKVVWQTDYDKPTARLILYRSHSGLIWEDNLLDKDQRADWSPDRQLFVPLCTGISYFKVQVPQPQNLAQKLNDPNRLRSSRPAVQNQYDQKADEQQFFDIWNQPQLPPAVLVTISFANPIEGRGVGGAEVPDELKVKRTIVIDRSKKMNFVYVPLAQRDANLPRDVNAAMAARQASGQDQPRLYGGGGSGGTSGDQPPSSIQPPRRHIRPRTSR